MSHLSQREADKLMWFVKGLDITDKIKEDLLLKIKKNKSKEPMPKKEKKKTLNKKKELCKCCKKQRIPEHHHNFCEQCWDCHQISRGNFASNFVAKSSKMGR